MVKAIDCWCNLFTPEGMRKIYSGEMEGILEWWKLDERARGHSVEEFISLLDEAGVEKVIIPAMQIFSYTHKRMLTDISVADVFEQVSKRPDRFAGLYGINPLKKMDGVRELEKVVKEYGFIGAHIHSYGFGIPVNHRDYWPFYAKCVELDVPVQLQVGHSAELMPSELGRPIHLDDIALYFPELRIIGAHTGWPWVEELIALAWKHPNVYIGTSAHAPKYWDQSLVNFLNTRGRGKVLWGTDFPVVSHKVSVAQVEEKNLREDARAQLLREAAIKVFKL